MNNIVVVLLGLSGFETHPFSCTSNNIALDEFEPITALLLSLSLPPRPQGSVYSIYIVIVSIFSL